MNANVKKKFDLYGNAYKDTSGVNSTRNNLIKISRNAPVYTDSFADQINTLYGKVKDGSQFNYDPKNDAAFRQYADEYRALSGLAITGNQAQAQDLTGGYGSTYAPEVAQQGLARLNEGVFNAQPEFYQQAQNAYMAQQDAITDLANAANEARSDEAKDYAKQAAAYNDRYDLALKQYEDKRDLAYRQYSDNRSYWNDRYNQELEQQKFKKDYQLDSYDIYNKLASTQCGKYAEKGNNKGMKAYLQGLVKKGKITQYMADNLYNSYKVTKSGGGGGGGRRGGSGGRRRSGSGYGSGSGSGSYLDLGSGGNGGNGKNNNGMTDKVNDFIYAHGSMTNRRAIKMGSGYSNLSAANLVTAIRNGGFSQSEITALFAYYGLSGNENKKTTKKKGNKGGGTGSMKQMNKMER